ncbi:MAG: hypothetical protein ACPGYK_00010 [Flavobacteriales bacterium]
MRELLRTGMSKGDLEAAILALEQNPEDVKALLEILYAQGASKVQARKASWVIRHLAKRHPKLLLPEHEKLFNILINARDSAVIREILKALSAPELQRNENDEQSKFLAILGMDYIAAQGVPKALRYLGLKLVNDRWTKMTCSTQKETLSNVDTLLIRLSEENDDSPLMQSARRMRDKWSAKVEGKKHPFARKNQA